MRLSRLIVLDITKNKVEQFPSGFSRLTALSDLHASENCIEELPEDFGEVESMYVHVHEMFLILQWHKNTQHPSEHHSACEKYMYMCTYTHIHNM